MSLYIPSGRLSSDLYACCAVERLRSHRYMARHMTKMFKIALPDGSVREMPEGSTPADVAAAIGPGLAKAALAARIDGEVRRLHGGAAGGHPAAEGTAPIEPLDHLPDRVDDPVPGPAGGIDGGHRAPHHLAGDGEGVLHDGSMFNHG